MLRNHLKLAYRHLLKYKTFSLINIFGLAVGMAAGLLIWQYVRFELSYDDFRKPTVYRAIERSYQYGELTGERAQTVPALAPALVSDMPEVVRAARLIHSDKLMPSPVMQVGERSFHEEKVYFADAAFLRLLSYDGHMDKRHEELTNQSILRAIEEASGTNFTRDARRELSKGAGEVDIVNSGLEETMVTAYHTIYETYKQKGTQNLRTASFVCSIEKIAAAYLSRGIFP